MSHWSVQSFVENWLSDIPLGCNPTDFPVPKKKATAPVDQRRTRTRTSQSSSLSRSSRGRGQSPTKRRRVASLERHADVVENTAQEFFDVHSLLALDLPIIKVATGINTASTLPIDIQQLFLSCEEIIIHRTDIFPIQVRKDIEAIYPRASRRLEWFRQGPRDEALTELDFLRDMHQKARHCSQPGCAELIWNELVHQPLLDFALAHEKNICVQPCFGARISPAFWPTTCVRDHEDFISKARVDFCLTLVLDDGNPPIESDRDASSPDTNLNARIAKRVQSQPEGAQSVNQTSHLPLRFAPIACNIQTKSPTSQHIHQVQLSIWTAAWYARMLRLVPERIEEHGLISLPLLHIMRHDWRLSFACWRGSTVEIVGELLLGDTRSLLGLYTIVANLRKIGEWIVVDYRRWIEKVFAE